MKLPTSAALSPALTTRLISAAGIYSREAVAAVFGLDLSSARKRQAIAMAAAQRSKAAVSAPGAVKKPCASSSTEASMVRCETPPQPGALPALGANVYTVEALLAVRTKGREREFLVRWQDYGADSDTWEKESDVLDKGLIKSFEATLASNSSPQRWPWRQEGRKRPASEALAQVRMDDVTATGRKYLRAPQQAATTRARLGSRFQVERLPRVVGSVDKSLHDLLDGLSPPLCRCGVHAVAGYGRWWCARRPRPGASTPEDNGAWEAPWCAFEEAPASPIPSRPHSELTVGHADPTRASSASLALTAARSLAAGLTAAAYGPMEPWCFVSPSNCGLGLFARSPLEESQFICEYRGPRLPLRLQTLGSYVLQIPGTSVVIDGASENSPFPVPRAAAIYANHSAAPNARLECWPALRPQRMELRQRMVLVASERIDAGSEIRINYEASHDVGGYWKGSPPPETPWRSLYVPPPPSTLEEPVLGRLAQVQAAAASGEALPELRVQESCAAGAEEAPPLPWSGDNGGDARLRMLVPMLTTKSCTYEGALARMQTNWAMLSTHLPGRSGRECHDRWLQLKLEAMAECDSSDGEEQEAVPRCLVLGCKRQLVRCHGAKDYGHAVGCAEESHVLCVPCLERWFVAQNELRAQADLSARGRRVCPVCQVELRSVREPGFHLGLRKLEWSWEEDACLV